MSADECASCSGRCCYDVAVGITGADALRIARARSLAIEAFVTVASADAGDAGAFRLDDGFGALVLARHEREERACYFLTNLADPVKRCGTHPSRPRVCRAYPMTLRDDVVVLRADVACARSDWNIDAIDASLWRRDLDAYAGEWMAYERIVARWNASGNADLTTYFTFLRDAYGTAP